MVECEMQEAIREPNSLAPNTFPPLVSLRPPPNRQEKFVLFTMPVRAQGKYGPGALGGSTSKSASSEPTDPRATTRDRNTHFFGNEEGSDVAQPPPKSAASLGSSHRADRVTWSPERTVSDSSSQTSSWLRRERRVRQRQKREPFGSGNRCSPPRAHQAGQRPDHIAPTAVAPRKL